jgi:hypothetical protein
MLATASWWAAFLAWLGHCLLETDGELLELLVSLVEFSLNLLKLGL